MAGTKLQHIIDEITTDLKQTIDDAEISPVAVGFWIITLANDILGKHIGKRDSGAFMTTWPAVPVIEPIVTSITGIVAGRKYLLLPATIFDFDKDGAIDYISYISDGSPGCPPEFEFVNFERTTPKEARWLNFHPQTKPSPKRPYFYRTGDYFPLLGIENINIQFVEMGIYSTIKPIDEIDPNAPFTFPEELIGILRRQLLDLGRFILVIPSGRTNEGDDPISENSGVPTQKIATVSNNQGE